MTVCRALLTHILFATLAGQALAVPEPPQSRPVDNDYTICADDKRDPKVIAAACLRLADRPDPAKIRAIALLDAARAFQRMNKMDEALESLTRALGVLPDWEVALGLRCETLAHQRKFERALKDCDRAIALNPKSAPAFLVRAEVRMNMYEYDRALADASEALRIQPTNYYALLVRGSVYTESGKTDLAIADLDAAIRLEPQKRPAWNERCWARATANRELDRALADCNKALGIEPTSQNTRDSLAFVYLRMGKHTQAIAEYDAVLKVDPKRAASLFGRGIAKRRSGRAKAGGKDISAALALDPNVRQRFAAYGVH